MPVLDRLMSYLHGPISIRCPRMVLLARDHEPSLAEGEGVFEIVSATEFQYRMIGRPVDLSHTLHCLNRQRENRYDPLSRFRIEMTDSEGQNWEGGWTVPAIDFDSEPWVFSGTCNAFSTDVHGERSELGGSEARFLIPRESSPFTFLRRFVRSVNPCGQPLPCRTIEVLGTPVVFSFDGNAGVLTLSAPSTSTLPAAYAENWLGEPLRILFGQLVYPRLVERRFPDGRSMLSIRKSPRWRIDSAWTALWAGEREFSDDEGFFDLYCNLLTLVARRGEWESHTVTGFYEEVIQATRGSRWVCALTLASSIEGITRLLVPRDTLRPDADSAALASLSAHIAAWGGASRLKDAAIDFVRRSDFVSVNRALFVLADSGIGSRKQVNSWKNVRNRVAHGELVSPYSSEEDDQILLDMAHLLRTLTCEAARRARCAVD